MTNEEFIQQERKFVEACLNRPARTQGEAKFALEYDKAIRRICKVRGINYIEIYRRS